MKRINLFIQTTKASIEAVETPAKKMEQLEAAKLLAPQYLNGIWLTISLAIIGVLESTIKIS
jgi:hypothetical protein